MVKYYCNRCWTELKDTDLISNITLENYEFYNAGSIPANKMLDIKQLLCKECTRDIKAYILAKPASKHNLFMSK